MADTEIPDWQKQFSKIVRAENMDTIKAVMKSIEIEGKGIDPSIVSDLGKIEIIKPV